jgi:hypothetical protein
MQATKTPAFIVSLVLGMAAPAVCSGQDLDVGASSEAIFWIGKPDGSAREFGGGDRASTGEDGSR